MVAITAALVKELRERTNAGMMDCKKALVAAEGDIEAAIEEMRKSGVAKADKKADRTAAEGLIVIKHDAQVVAMLEVNCETDFVARDENFTGFVERVTELALSHRISGLDELMSQAYADDAEQTVDLARKALIAKLGENISVRRLTLLTAAEGQHIGYYLHGGRIGVVTIVKGNDAQFAKDVAMHVAASNPEVLSPEQVSQTSIDKEKAIFTAQAEESGKPAEIIEKMIQGRIKKFLDEASLLGQPYVKDPSVTVGKYLQQAGAEAIDFVRYEAGEGIEKKAENFVEEVMAQARGDA